MLLPPRARNRAARAATIVAAVLAATAACTVGPSAAPDVVVSGPRPVSTPAPPSNSTPVGPGGPGRAATTVWWGPCPDLGPAAAPEGDVIDCGTLHVPVDHGAADSPVLRLQLTRVRAPDTPVDAPLLFLLADRPAGHDAITLATSVSAPVRSRYQLIVVDRRGTGDSLPIDCVDPFTADAIVAMGPDPTADDAGAVEAIGRSLTFDCGDLVGTPLTLFNSTAAADDLDIVRASLDATTVSILAAGAGATIGAVYAHRYPARIAHAVLDSPADPLAAPSASALARAAAAESLTQDFAAWCTRQAAPCPLGEDPAATIADMVQRWARPGQWEAGRWLTGGSLLLALRARLGDETGWPDLAAAIAAFDDERPDGIAAILADPGAGLSPDALAAELVYRCNDTAERLDPAGIGALAARAAQTAPLFGPHAVGWAALCSSWPVPDDPLPALSARGAAPILVLGSVHSPVHAMADAEAVARQLASAVLVGWQSGHDDAYRHSECVRAIVDDYLTADRVPAVSVRCPG